MDDGKVITERICLVAALTLLIKSGETDGVQANELIQKEGYEGLYNLLNTRYKEAYVNKV